jgi:hypothetical protein
LNMPPEDMLRFASEVRFFGGTGNMLNLVGVKDAHLVGFPRQRFECGLTQDELRTVVEAFDVKTPLV